MKRLALLSLILAYSGFCFEEDTISNLKIKADSYFSKFKRAKLELFFDQPKYSSRDTILFRIAYLSAGDLKPVIGKQIVHICLFDQFGKKVLTRWASVTNGFSTLEMIIPDDILPGKYLLVAFTDWMKNFDQSLFFQREFEIAGKYIVKDDSPKDTLMFFPEGGHLISSIENNLAIRYRGNSLKNKLTIWENEKELTSINLTSDSVSLFRFTPQLNTKYYAAINTENGIKKFLFPTINPSGVSIQVDAAEPRIRLFMECSKGLESKKENFYIALFSNSGIIFQSEINFDERQKALLTLPTNIPNKILQLVLFDSKFNLLISRVVHSGDIKDRKLELDKLQEIYTTRQLINLNLKLINPDGYSGPGIFSCRINNDDLLPELDSKEMDYLTFQSDISNSFPLKEFGATPQTINNYLIAQTCPWFNWKKIIENDKTPLAYKPQQNLTISGEAIYANNGRPVRDSTLLMFFLEKNLFGYEAYTNSKGNFSFPLLTINQEDRFFYTASLKGNDIDEVIVRTHDPDSSLSFYAKPWKIDKNVIDQYTVYSLQKQTISNSYSFFANTQALNDSTYEPNKAMEEELSGADLTISINDYLMMPTMEEVLREIVRGVEYRKINGRAVVRVYTTGKEPTNHTGPLYVIDGVITKNPAYMLSLKPSDVISIKIVKDSRKLFAIGKLGANGVILIKTKLRSKIVKEKHVLDFAGLLPKAHGLYLGNTSSQIPDLRSCLFWSSGTFNGSEEFKLSFKTSDDAGRFKILVSGFTEDGVPFYFERPFQVKYSRN